MTATTPERGVRTVVEYIRALPLQRERQYARQAYHALMRDQSVLVVERPAHMSWKRGEEIDRAIKSRLPERRAEPRPDPMCMYPTRCSGTCIKQFEDGFACDN